MSTTDRIAAVTGALESLEVDALLVTNLTNVRYLTGFSGSNGQVLITASGATFFTDPRYEARAGDLVSGADIVLYPNKLLEALPGRLPGIGTLGIEADTMSVAERDELEAGLEGVTVSSQRGVVEELRRVKDESEIAAIRRAVEIADEAYATMLERLAPGMEERRVALEIEVLMRERGADAVSFDPIIGSGPLSAHIHHTASDRVFEKGDLVLLDFGARVDGYCSDITRTVVLGPATDEQREVYGIVLEAQRAGIDAVSTGAGGRDVDAAARAVIEAAGHGDRFAHGLGHGVGLDIHESPRLSKVSTDSLRAGDVVTVEPGIYLPGDGGVRIEDDVHVTEEGPVVLNRAPKEELLEL